MLDISFSFLNFWSKQSSDLNIIICESFDVFRLLPPRPHRSQPHPQLFSHCVNKDHLYKNCLFIKAHLRFSESARLMNAFTGPLFAPQSLYFLRRRSGASRTTKKVTSIPLELPASPLDRGWGVVVGGGGGGGLGSSLQQVLASVELPLGGQQKLP